MSAAPASSPSYTTPDAPGAVDRARPRYALTWARYPSCTACGRRVAHASDAYGDGLRWCPRCALVADRQRPPAPPPAPPRGRQRGHNQGRGWLR